MVEVNPAIPSTTNAWFRAEISVEGTKEIYGASLSFFAPFRNRECAFYYLIVLIFFVYVNKTFKNITKKTEKIIAITIV